MPPVYDPRRLDITVRQGGRTQEALHYEAHRRSGVVVRKRYRPQGGGSKGVKSMGDGQGKLLRHVGRVSWKKGTGEGQRKSGGRAKA